MNFDAYLRSHHGLTWRQWNSKPDEVKLEIFHEWRLNRPILNTLRFGQDALIGMCLLIGAMVVVAMVWGPGR